MNKLITFIVLLILPFNHVLSETNWITKKKSTNQKIEKIENQFANGIISKAQCVSKIQIIKSKNHLKNYM